MAQADRSSKAVVACMGFAQVATPAQNYGGKLSNIAYNSVGTKSKQSNFYQKTAKAACVDKQTGTYAHSMAKEVISTGNTFKERSTGRVGIKSEHTTTKTCRVGDKSGYSEYQVQERYRRVDYGGNSSGKGNSGNNGNNSINGKKLIKGISSSTNGIKASSNTKVSASIKTTSGARGSSRTKANASIKTSCSTKGSYH